MHKKFIVIAGAALCILGAALSGAAPAAAAPAARPAAQDDSYCNRVCLNRLADDFIKALLAHDPSILPHSPQVKYSENNVMLKLGDGLWATADGVETFKVYVDDPDAGAVGYYGVIDEDHTPDIFAARLKVVNGEVTEIETLVARKESANSTFPDPAALQEKPFFYENVPETARLSRPQLIALVNGYFDTIQLNTGKIYTSFDPDCARVENGVQTANNPNGTAVSKMGCEAQLKTGLLHFVTRIRDRRFLAVDAQKGLVLVTSFFDHAGTGDTFNLTDGTTFHVPVPFDRPYSFVMFGLFKIGQPGIRQIEAVIVPVPYYMPSVWK
jgi:hypothetical protein